MICQKLVQPRYCIIQIDHEELFICFRMHIEANQSDIKHLRRRHNTSFLGKLY